MVGHWHDDDCAKDECVQMRTDSAVLVEAINRGLIDSDTAALLQLEVSP